MPRCEPLWQAAAACEESRQHRERAAAAGGGGRKWWGKKWLCISLIPPDFVVGETKV
jgi:hypothetical protein